MAALRFSCLFDRQALSLVLLSLFNIFPHNLSLMPDDLDSEMKQFKRAPAVEKKIIDINPEKDIRVRIIGSVIDKGAGSIFVDDGSGSGEIIVEDPDEFEVGDPVIVLARVLPLEDDYELRAEIIKKAKNFDINLYRLATEKK